MEFVQEKPNKSVYKTFFIYFVTILLFIAIRIISSLGVFKTLSNNAVDLIYTTLIEVVCLFVFPMILYCLMIKVKPKQVFKTCNFTRLNARSIIISVAIGCIVYFITIMLSNFFNGIIQFLGYHPANSSSNSITTIDYLVQILTTALLPAFCEEFLHRGLLLQGTKHIGFHKAIFISGILFGLIHLNITQVFYAATLGIIIGYISVISKNIWPAIIIHFMNNFLSITNSYLLYNNKAYANFINTFYSWIGSHGLIFAGLLSAIFVIIILVLLYILVSRLYANTLIRKTEKAIREAYTKDGVALIDGPISIKNHEIREAIESTTNLNLDFDSVKNPIEILMPVQKNVYLMNYKDKIFMKASFILCSIVTLFTLIWGYM